MGIKLLQIFTQKCLLVFSCLITLHISNWNCFRFSDVTSLFTKCHSREVYKLTSSELMRSVLKLTRPHQSMVSISVSSNLWAWSDRKSASFVSVWVRDWGGMEFESECETGIWNGEWARVNVSARFDTLNRGWARALLDWTVRATLWSGSNSECKAAT